MLNHEYYMELAINLAKKTQGQTNINPVVGCVLVKDGSIIGLGAHLKRGEGHAEVQALRMAQDQAQGATMYITLEPCRIYGKTPPCTTRIIEAKIKKVIVATTDPNPLVAGQGIKALKEAGIEVEIGVLQEEAKKMNEKFEKYITTRLPFVTMKVASTLDGKMASKSGDSKWISNEPSREQVHMLRHTHQGIMVGIGTIMQDDPLLTTRLPQEGLNPIPIIIDSKLRIPLQSKVLKQKCIIFTAKGTSESKRQALMNMGTVVVPCGSDNVVDLEFAMQWLGENEIGSILLEGGPTLITAMMEKQLIDKVIIYMAPKIVGGKEAPSFFQGSGRNTIQEAISLQHLEVTRIEDNVCICGYPKYN